MGASGVQKIGLNGPFYYGTKGSQATSQSYNVRDVTLNLATVVEDMTTKNAYSHLMETEKVTLLSVSLEFECPNRTSDALVAALQTAYAAGDLIALRALDAASGKGIDADFYVANMSLGLPVKGIQAWRVQTTKPSDELRDPSLFA